jgi:hypothetical protein
MNADYAQKVQDRQTWSLLPVPAEEEGGSREIKTKQYFFIYVYVCSIIKYFHLLVTINGLPAQVTVHHRHVEVSQSLVA